NNRKLWRKILYIQATCILINSCHPHPFVKSLSIREIRQFVKFASICEIRVNEIRVMTLQQAQQQVDEWVRTVGVRYFSELTNMVILTEEVGELARIIVRQYGDQSFKESDKEKNLADEMADVLWVLICLANQTGVDLTEA